jgi:hypothetical protein
VAEVSVIPMSVAAHEDFSVSISALGPTRLLVRTGLGLRSTSCPVGILALPQAHNRSERDYNYSNLSTPRIKRASRCSNDAYRVK